MKKQIMIVVIGCLIGATSCTVEGGYIETRPADVVYTRPVAPGADYIWIDGDWVWGGGSYTWREGHWGRPRMGHTWVAGRWETGAHGYRWNRGRWR